MKIIKITSFYLFLFSTLIAANFTLADSNKTIDSTGIKINNWLIAGPVNAVMPVAAGTSHSSFKENNLLNFEPFEVHKIEPAAGGILCKQGNNSAEWEPVNGNILFSDKEKGIAQYYYAASYINTGRWIKAKLSLSSNQLLKAYLDGKEIISKTDNDPGKEETKDIELETGTHILLIKSLKKADNNKEWNLSGRVVPDSVYSYNDISFSSELTEFSTVEKLLEDPKIGDISVSADGEYAAVTVSQIPFGKDSKETWLNIYKTSDGTLFRSFRGGMNVTSVKWLQKGHSFSYTTTDKDEVTIWLYDPEKGTTDLVFSDDNISDYSWSPDGSYIIYSLTEKAPDNKSGIKLITGMDKRLPGSEDKNYLYRLTYPGRVNTRLTAGDKYFSLNSISDDGQKLLLSITDSNWDKRPYSYTSYYILNMSSMELDSVKTFDWPGLALFSPDAKKILFTGGASMFGNIGLNISEGKIPNDFDMQAYIYDIQSGKAECITKSFNPSIESAYWSRNKQEIYFNTTDRSFQHLYRYNIADKSFSLIKLDVDVLDEIEFSENYKIAVYRGSSAVVPDKFYSLNLKNGVSRLLFDPSEESYKHVKRSKSEVFTFKNSRGQEIDGMVIYPPDFDSNKKYPAIVNYYGGTTPIDQAFEGRYPKNIWAANGYVVYILEPSGAIGYGQDFSSYHVNDWGNTTAAEIIEGTKQFLKTHPFVDSTKIGCIGASYGGFMTMNLLTKTNMFTAGISHAGISNLADYWGVGYWGYSYSAVATANSFPWNRKDIYVDFSPLFNADKITTPLLLLHGSSDTNVPPGESTQMFTALKLLGRDVKYIQIAGQDHHILEYKKRKIWTKTIIAYFDKYLKNQPQWWNSLYPDDENKGE
jgi:dipeptidyl aminopeptidase/acylaminoacyl peptidase